MILCQIDEAERYASISPALATALEWLKNHMNDTFVKGIYPVGTSPSGAEIFAKYEEPALLPREKTSLEAHRNYIDIQVPLKGTEIMGWAPLATLRHPRAAYDDSRDVIFYGDAAHSLLHVKVGQLAVFFPEDAHAPNIGLGNHRKLVVKVPVK